MPEKDVTIGIFIDHKSADEAINVLISGGFDKRALSIVGKGFQAEEKVVGFYNSGERIVFWGTRGTFWGGLWKLFSGGAFLTLPIIGHVMVLGSLASAVVSAAQGAQVVGGLSALGAALVSVGVQRTNVLEYEAALKSDGFLIMAHGNKADMKKASKILATLNPLQIETHKNTAPPLPSHIARSATA